MNIIEAVVKLEISVGLYNNYVLVGSVSNFDLQRQ